MNSIEEIAQRLYDLDPYGARDNDETIESIADTINSDPAAIIAYLLDIIDELQA